MIIAIYNNKPYHLEVIGFLLEFAQKMEWTVDVYCQLDKDKHGWVEFYNKLFPNLAFYKIPTENFLSMKVYDLIIFATHESLDKLHCIDKKRIISITHDCPTPKSINVIPDDNIQTISLRLQLSCPVKWIYSCYQVIETKNLYNSDTLQVAIVGSLDIDIDTFAVKRLRDGVKNLKFIVINRKFSQKLYDILGDHQEWFVDCSSKEMMNHIQNSDFLFVPKLKNSDYIDNLISSAIPLAISMLTPVLAPSNMLQKLQLGVAGVEYDQDSSSPIIPIKPNLSDMKKARDIMIKITNNVLLNLSPVIYAQNKIQNENTYPIIIHFMWLSKDRTDHPFPKSFDKILRTWKAHNKNSTFLFWSDSSVRNLIKNDLPEFLEFYDAIEPTICRCDFSRFAVVYVHGGIYSDLDFYCCKNISPILINGTYFIREPIEHEKNLKHKLISNGFFSSPARNQFVYDWMKHMVSSVNTDIIVKNNDVVTLTGPIGLYKFYDNYKYSKPRINDPCDVLRYTSKQEISKSCSAFYQENFLINLWNEGSNWGNEGSNWGKVSFIKRFIIILSILIVIFLLIRCLYKVKQKVTSLYF